jgi:hypothetical protein
MNCDELLDRASDFIDGTLDAATLADVDAHVSSCESCRSLIADLRRVQQLTQSLDRQPLPAGGWARVRARLEADPEFAAAGAGRTTLQRPVSPAQRSVRWLALAAALVLVVGSALYYVVSRPLGPSSASLPPPATGTPASANASQQDLVQSIEADLQAAASHYEKAIANLEAVAGSSDSPLDPELMATLRTNLQLIDKAIDDSRAALKAAPESPLAQESLFDAFRRKVALLQDTIALMNEMRKGDADGAARVVQGLNKS